MATPGLTAGLVDDDSTSISAKTSSNWRYNEHNISKGGYIMYNIHDIDGVDQAPVAQEGGRGDLIDGAARRGSRSRVT